MIRDVVFGINIIKTFMNICMPRRKAVLLYLHKEIWNKKKKYILFCFSSCSSLIKRKNIVFTKEFPSQRYLRKFRQYNQSSISYF
jgi:hypothetical protein